MARIIGWLLPGERGNPTAGTIPIYDPIPYRSLPPTPETVAQLDELRAVVDPIERLVRTVATYVTVGESVVEGPGGRRKPMLTTLGFGSSEPLVDQICPGWRQAGAWDGRQVARWFAATAAAQGISTTNSVPWPEPKRSFFGKVSRTGDRVDEVAKGPAVGVWPLPPVLLTWQSAFPGEAMICEDGRLHTGWVWKAGRQSPGMEVAGHLNTPALVYLGGLLGWPVRWNSSMSRPRPLRS